MKKLLSLFSFVLFIGYSMAWNNGILFQTNKLDFKNDYVYFSAMQPIKPKEYILDTNPDNINYILSLSWTTNPFYQGLCGGSYIIWPIGSFTGAYPCTWMKLPQYLSNNILGGWNQVAWIAFSPTTLSLGFFGSLSDTQDISAWSMWNTFPSTPTNQLTLSFSDILQTSASFVSYRYITALSSNNDISIFNSSWAFQPNEWGSAPAVIQKFTNDEVIRYDDNGGSWSSAAMWSNNSQYFLSHGNAFSYVRPTLDGDGNGYWSQLYFGAVGNVDVLTGLGYIDEDPWVLILSPNSFGTRKDNYKRSTVVISKDPDDPKKLLGGIYANCTCSTIQCISDYCTPSQVWHWKWQIATTTDNPYHDSTDCTGSTNLLPYVTTSSFAVNLNTVENEYWAPWKDNRMCNPVNEWFYYPWQWDKPFIADTSLEGSELCIDENYWFYSTTDRNCLELVSDTSVSPFVGASSGSYLYSGYGTVSWGLVSGSSLWASAYINSVLSNLEQTYWFTPQSCWSGSTVYSWNTLLAYSDAWPLQTQRLWVYCDYVEKVADWEGNNQSSILTGNQWDIDQLLVGAWWSTLFNCPTNYQASTSISLFLWNLPWLSIIKGTVLDINLLWPLTCLIGWFNYWMSKGIVLDTTSFLTPNTTISSLDYSHWKLAVSSSSNTARFSQIFGLLLSIPAVYLAFKMIL